ncbi:MAG: nucleotide exchange factor GrpE, partial [Victivallaceae bacterium]
VKFDPEIHEAIAYEPSETVQDGYVVKMMNCGYKLGDLLLRPARVIVSSGKAPAPAAEDTATKEEETNQE